ncbi:MAG: zinc-ribbon domain-containing protein [Clostridiales bacterium]|nr:zinc-ribbon domain-containing protein [Clostridiales bacterium]
MFCKKCGAEIDDNAVVCPKCGVATENYQKQSDNGQKPTKGKEGNGIAIAGFICSFFIPLLGWIFGGIGLARSKQRNGKGKGFAIAALTIASVVFLIALGLQM